LKTIKRIRKDIHKTSQKALEAMIKAEHEDPKEVNTNKETEKPAEFNNIDATYFSSDQAERSQKDNMTTTTSEQVYKEGKMQVTKKDMNVKFMNKNYSNVRPYSHTRYQNNQDKFYFSSSEDSKDMDSSSYGPGLNNIQIKMPFPSGINTTDLPKIKSTERSRSEKPGSTSKK